MREIPYTDTSSFAHKAAYTFAQFVTRHTQYTLTNFTKARAKAVASTKAQAKASKARRAKSEASRSTPRHSATSSETPTTRAQQKAEYQLGKLI